MVGYAPALSPRRSALVAVIMFVLLLACVAAAGWLVWARTTVPDDRGREILAEIRERGLGALLPDEPTVRWYIGRTKNGEAFGWIREVIEPAEDGFRGKTDRRLHNGYIETEWSLNAAAERGAYLSRLRTRDGAQDVKIVLEGGRVAITRDLLRGSEAGRGEAPGMYLPEGTSDIAGYLAARGERPAGFYMIADEVPVAGGEPYFTRVTMHPLGEGRLLVEYAVLGRESRTEYRYDDTGAVETFTYPKSGDTYTRVDDPRKVAAEFPGDDAMFAFPETRQMRRPGRRVIRIPLER